MAVLNAVVIGVFVLLQNSRDGAPRVLVWVLCAAFPLVLSYVLYWLPFWLGASQDQASAWAPLAVGVWSVAGLVAGLLVAAVLFRIQRRRTRRV
jgi:hypothetical protein